jgi:DNA repair protein SbcC/Rad50
MRIKKVTVENFRCYFGEHTFPLDSEITILFGENGFGKSSFFDAIEWCLTGSINRFISNDKKILYNFLSEPGSNCSVSIEFDNGNSLIRSFIIQEKMRETIKLISINGNTINTGQKCLEDFIDPDVDFQSNKKELIETTSLIKQALILSQDQVTDFILRDDPNERFNALADIMGYKKWTMTINNLKKVNDKIRSNIRKDQAQITTYEKLMSDKVKEKQEVNVYAVSELLRKYNIKLNQDTLLLLTGIKDGINKDLILYSKNINELSRLMHLGEYNYIGYKERVDELKMKLHNSFNLREKAKGLLSKISNKNEDVIRILNSVKKEEKLVDEKQKLEEEIKIIHGKVGNVLVNDKNYLNNIDEEIKHHEHDLMKIGFTMGSYNNYIAHKEIVKKNPLSILNQEISIGKLKKELNLLEKKIKKFDQIINSKQGNSELNKLNNSIQEIYKYVLENSINDKCPVCSADNNDNLRNNIYRNIQSNLEKIVKDSSVISKVVNRRNELKKMFEKKEKSARNSLKRLLIDKEDLVYSEKHLNEILVHERFSKDLFEADREFISKSKKEKEEKISNLNQKKLLLFELEKLKAKYTQFVNIRNTNSSDNESLMKEILRLEKHENKVKNIIKRVNENIKNLDKDHDNNKQLLSLWNNSIDNNEFSIQLKEIYTKRKEFITHLRNELEEINRLEKLLQIIQENDSKNKLINKYKNDMNVLKSKISELTVKHREINSFIENVYMKIGSQALDYFNQQDSSIQKYFRYLNPMPTSNRVFFKSDKDDELELIMSIEGQDGDYTDLSNVQYSMSSGQLNVLAISLFLAINEGQTLSKLDLIGIDDPIQNMDDVNQFSICDVFSNIKKQLILSTHDYDFLKLFIKKNEHRVKDIKVFMLESDRFANTQVKEVTF